jgi:metacaspase-1
LSNLSADKYRVVWVHGIGHPAVGYSDGWREAFNQYLQLPDGDFVEVLWSPAYDAQRSATPEEGNLSRTLAMNLRARGSAVASATSVPLVGEWSELEPRLRAFPRWLLDPEDYIGEFIKYLMNEDIRAAVKERLKERLRPLANQGFAISIVSHSWGTVVAYESLLDLQNELPIFQLANLFTLGSPLWLVQHLLHNHSGQKPANTNQWANIHALGDAIGSWLKPGYQVNQDFSVLDASHGHDPHGSYFLPGNAEVQQMIVRSAIEG